MYELPAPRPKKKDDAFLWHDMIVDQLAEDMVKEIDQQMY